MESERAGRVVCLEAAGTEGVVCLHMYVYLGVCTHSCVCSGVMVRFIYIRHSACSPSMKRGCECQLYALSGM